MELNTFIVATYCLIDEWLATQPRLRARGPQPTLTDGEILTIEVVGEYLGLDTDSARYRHFRRHDGDWFPALRRVHRTTFARRCANLWRVKERLWPHLVACAPHDPAFALLDRFPLPVCRFARAPRCRRFRGEAAFGRDVVARQTMYGFRIHARVAWPGVISRFAVAPANAHDLALVAGLTEATGGLAVGDRNYWSPARTVALAGRGLRLVAPYRSAKRDPDPSRSAALSRLRYRIDTVFGQLTERYRARKVWARDLWPRAGRLLRKALSHTLALVLNQPASNPPLQLARLLSD